jgi:hypothetical protein
MSNQQPARPEYVIKLDDRHTIVAAKAILDDGAEIPLHAKPQSNTGLARCHFFDDIIVGEYNIKPRIDWNPKTRKEGEDPVLDVNIFKNGVELKKEEQWHHTTRERSENGLYVYTWKPEIEGLKSIQIQISYFKLQTTNQQHLGGKSNIKAEQQTSITSTKSLNQWYGILS